MIRYLVAACALACATSVQAQEADEGRFRIGVTGGTLGVGPEVGFRFSENVGVRGNLTFLSISRDIESDDITYDANLRLRSGGAMLDLFPFGGGFRISAGARINGNRVRGVAQPNAGSSFEIDDTVYTAQQIGTLTARTKINRVAPSLTLGYGGGLSRGVFFGIEAGALFQGSVRIQPLTITGVCASATPPTGCGTLTQDLEAERVSINDDIDGYKIYPILQLSLGYQF